MIDIRKPVRGRSVLLALLVLLAYQFIVLPFAVEKTHRLSPAAYALDTQFSYTPDHAMTWGQTMFDEARTSAIISYWTFDLAYPLCYGVCAALLWGFALTRLFPSGGRWAAWQYLSILAWCAPVFDLIENTALSLVLLLVPPFSKLDIVGGVIIAKPKEPASAFIAATVASIATPAKWIALGVAFWGAVLLLLALFVRAVLITIRYHR